MGSRSTYRRPRGLTLREPPNGRPVWEYPKPLRPIVRVCRRSPWDESYILGTVEPADGMYRSSADVQIAQRFNWERKRIQICNRTRRRRKRKRKR